MLFDYWPSSYPREVNGTFVVDFGGLMIYPLESAFLLWSDCQDRLERMQQKEREKWLYKLCGQVSFSFLHERHGEAFAERLREVHA